MRDDVIDVPPPPRFRNRRRGAVSTATAVTACFLFLTAVRADDEASRAAVDFFERRVRPILSEHCVRCHGPDAQENELRVDSLEALLKGGQRGPALVSGESAQSLLVQAIRRVGELKMPPDGALKATEIADLERWIERGAVWPEQASFGGADGPAAGTPRTVALTSEHWAFQPIRKPPAPPVDAEHWVRTPIDRFILARLEASGLAPAPPANRRTLIRRLYFDLIGLPPSFDEVEAYVADDSADADENLVDQLLSRPEYGQRWARHWLDVARYSDTTGYQEGGQPRYPYAWTYRDYVVRSFNEDTPLDQFILEQLAADQLDLSEADRWKLAGMGFLTVGPRFNYVRHEIIDDRIDVITRGLLGLTVACARCHDHKYDPILADDYYGLYGVLANSQEPLYTDLPTIGSPRGDFSRYRQFRTEVARATRRFEQFHARVHRRVQHEMRFMAGDYLRHLVQWMPEHRTVTQPSFETDRGAIRRATPYGTGAIIRWQHYIASRGTTDPVFGLWNQLARLSSDQLSARMDGLIRGSDDANSALVSELRQASPRSMLEVADVYGRLLESVYAEWIELSDSDGTVDRLPDPAREQLRQVLYAGDSPVAMNQDEAHDCYTDGEFNQYMGLKRELDTLFVEFQDVAEPRAMVMIDRDAPQEPRVFERGNATRPGRYVSRQYFRAFQDIGGGQPFSQGSGRLELAQAIVHPDNPLTARVMVNRVWQWHFGRGLVETASDFGNRSAAPSHPLLLDWLAADFVEHGWSLKRLHQQIVMSATYRQSSLEVDSKAPAESNQAVMERDPDNRLLWRMNRRRLEFEAFRDALLDVSGELPDEYDGGPPRPELDAWCRSIYLVIDRYDLPLTFATFDFPSPDLSTARRSETTVPPQALFLMNSPFTSTVAQRIVEQMFFLEPESESAHPRDRVQWLYRRILSRSAVPSEVEACLHLVMEGAVERSQPTPADWRVLAHVLLMSNEFMFVD